VSQGAHILTRYPCPTPRPNPSLIGAATKTTDKVNTPTGTVAMESATPLGE